MADLGSGIVESTTKYELNDPDFWKQGGDDFFNQQDYDKALKCYDVSLSLNARNPDVWNRKGIVFLKSGMVEEALFCRSQLSDIIADTSVSVQDQSGKTKEASIQPDIPKVSSVPTILDSPSLKPFNPFSERRKREIEDID